MTYIAYMKTPNSAGFEATVPFEAKESPLLCHELGLMQTATGYGNRLASPYKVKVRNKWRRVYYVCYSNVSTFYIGKPGFWEYIVEDITRKGS